MSYEQTAINYVISTIAFGVFTIHQSLLTTHQVRSLRNS